MLRQRRVYALAAVVAGLLAGSAALPAFAQDATQAPAAQAPAAPTADVPTAPALPEPSPEQLAVAIQFLKVSGLTTGFDDIIPQFMQQASQIYTGQRPELRGMIGEAAVSLVPEFIQKRAELDKNLAKFYTTEFTEDELKQMVAFYETPVGKKFSAKQQDILRDSIPVVQKWTIGLQNDIMKRMKEEVEKKGGKLGPSDSGPQSVISPQPDAPAAPKNP
jgi:hypothetical protein